MTRFPLPFVRDNHDLVLEKEYWWARTNRDENVEEYNPEVRIPIGHLYPEQTDETQMHADVVTLEPLSNNDRVTIWEELFSRLPGDDLPIFYQNARRLAIEIILQFHDWLLIFLISIARVILKIIILIRKSVRFRHIGESEEVELGWTLLPCIVLLFLFLPSLRLLYIVEEGRAGQTVKAVGRQWYWEYEYPDFPAFNSYMVSRGYRFLDADNRLTTPVKQARQILITAADVLHSWTIPAMAVKADAVPGRVNKQTIISYRPGVFYGQCSEICGSNHRFMPIALECIFNWGFTLKVIET